MRIEEEWFVRNVERNSFRSIPVPHIELVVGGSPDPTTPLTAGLLVTLETFGHSRGTKVERNLFRPNPAPHIK